jgi:hypothetical protein
MVRTASEQENKPDNIFNLFPAAVPRRTDAELVHYREILPKLLQMLDEWERVKGCGGCPVARSIVIPPPNT